MIFTTSLSLSQPSAIRDTTTVKPGIKEKNLDIRVFRSINNSRSKFKDGLLEITDRSVLWVSLLTPLSQFAVSSFSGNYYDQNSAVLNISSQILNYTLTYTTKIIIQRKRPHDALSSVYVRKSFADDKYSFPSGHTSSAFAGATSYFLRYPEYPHIYLPMYLYAIAVGYGRIYWGMHYPTDVLMGAVYGISSAIIVHSMRKPILKFKNNIIGKNQDESKSSGGTNTLYFLGSFATSIVINEFIFRNNTKVKLTTTTQRSGMFINISANF